MTDARSSGAGPSSHDKPAPSLPVPLELIQDIPEEKREELVRYISEISYIKHFSGPLPPASELAQYNQDVQRIIVNEAVQHRRHRATLEDRGQKLFFIRDILALLCAFTLALILIGGCIVIILSGYSVVGLLGIGGTVSLIAGAFLYRDHNNRKERKAREALEKPTLPPELDDRDKAQA